MHRLSVPNKSRARKRTFHQKQHSAIASREPDRGGPVARRPADALVADVAIVTVVETGPLDGETVAGEKLHDAPGAKPEHVNETAELKPFAGVIDKETVPLRPAVRMSEVGDAATEKSAGVMLTL